MRSSVRQRWRSWYGLSTARRLLSFQRGQPEAGRQFAALPLRRVTLPALPQPPLGGLDPQVLARFLPLLQEYSRSNSQTMQLLYALRPFLKESKQDKVERAARLARLIHLGKKFLTDWGDGHV